ncbi:MAG: FHA domain-containing protein [Inquilinaceae bacterium]
MSITGSEAAILLADITGSTPLFEEEGDIAAMRMIGDCLDHLREIVLEEQGTFVHSKGDDILSIFPEAGIALRAGRRMLSPHRPGALAIHAGAHFGSIVHARDDVFGDAVNLTARLAALANPGEILLSQSFVNRLPDEDSKSLRMLDTITLKGKSVSTEIYSLLDDDATMIDGVNPVDLWSPVRLDGLKRRGSLLTTVRYGSRSLTCEAGTSLSIGRSTACDIFVAQPWVSRRHAIITVRHGKVELRDRSSAGTYVLMRDGFEFFTRRETVLLSGSGIICPTFPPSDNRAIMIRYGIDQR